MNHRTTRPVQFYNENNGDFINFEVATCYKLRAGNKIKWLPDTFTFGRDVIVTQVSKKKEFLRAFIRLKK